MTKCIPSLTTPLPALPAPLEELQPAWGTVASRSLAAARLIRKALLLELWPQLAGNPLQERALEEVVWRCRVACRVRYTTALPAAPLWGGAAGSASTPRACRRRPR